MQSLLKWSLSQVFFIDFGSDFQRAIYDFYKFFVVFWSIWNDSPCNVVVNAASKVFPWFWTFPFHLTFVLLFWFHQCNANHKNNPLHRQRTIYNRFYLLQEVSIVYFYFSTLLQFWNYCYWIRENSFQNVDLISMSSL